MSMSRDDTPGRRRLSILLTVAFVLAMLLGVGPGVALVNRPESVLGLPILYVWGLLWFAVHVAIATTAYIYLWSSADTHRQTGQKK